MASIDYVEAGAVVIPSRVTLTTNYSPSEPGGANRARIVAAGSCASITGGASGSSCAVGLSHGAVLERFTVSTPPNFVTNAIVTAAGVAGGLDVASLVDVVATQAAAAGIRSFGDISIGPRVSATRNGAEGLRASCAFGNSTQTVSFFEPSPLPTVPTNVFDENTLSGISVAGSNCSVGLRGVQANGNRGHGLSLNLAPVSASGTYPTAVLENIRANGNFNAGLSITGGRVRLGARAGVINEFNGNGVQPSGAQIGYGIRVLSSAPDWAQLVTDLLGTTPSPTIAHAASRNAHGGVLLAMGTGGLGLTHELRSMEVRGNGVGGANPVDGVTVQLVPTPTLTVQPNALLRGCVVTGNTGANLRFEQGTGNVLDIGTASAPGRNVFFDPLGTQRASVCFHNRSAMPRTQQVDVNRWSSATTCLPFTPNQTTATACNANPTPFDFVVVASADAGVSFTAVTGCY
jgi:hypothetical protein